MKKYFEPPARTGPRTTIGRGPLGRGRQWMPFLSENGDEPRGKRRSKDASGTWLACHLLVAVCVLALFFTALHFLTD